MKLLNGIFQIVANHSVLDFFLLKTQMSKYGIIIIFACNNIFLGFMVDFISPCLTSGFTSASAIIIIVAQLKNFLGCPLKSHDTFEVLKELSQKYGQIKLYDALLGSVCIVFLLILKVSYLQYLKHVFED